ncbi:hypothetical protein ACSV9I_09900 [Rhizobium sp. G187]|uniref:hypothetical protein n=1 Tax=Rhizobium sp. G187 TaxID=3451352 RepID=UPI003EE47F91
MRKQTLTLCLSALVLATAVPAAARPPHFAKWLEQRNAPPVDPNAPKAKKSGKQGAASHLPPELQEARERMFAGKSVEYATLQRLADSGDGVAAFRLAERISAKQKPELATHALHYFTLAVTDNRGYAVRNMLRILEQPDLQLSPSHLAAAEAALTRQAAKGNALAVDGLLGLYTKGHPFGSKPERFEKLLAAGGTASGQIAYGMAITLLSNPDASAEDREKAGRYLAIARDKGSLGMQAAAHNLLAQIQTLQTQPQAEVQQ